ncbi:MAG: M15 family metallopeptidase [Oscillospiraceae bacterium]|nr:M15 family metallopeptidase [Oscillospiraceae bacterium]
MVNQENNFDASIPKTVSVYEHKSRSYLVKDIYLSVTPETIKALNDWMEAFAAEAGITDVNIVSGWRSFADQSAIYDNAVASKGQAHADAYIALPGHSEHHTGLAVDLDTYNVENGTSGGFDGDGEYAWAVQHAWEYGFIQRYPPSKSGITGIDYESWHFRYVGLPHSYVMASENLCLEEYIDYLRNFAFSGEHLLVSCLGASYELYFCPEDQVVVPVSGSYTVSGNNVDGYVIVINTSE